MRGLLTAVLAAVLVTVPAVAAQAEPGGRGDDGGDAFRPHDSEPEAAKADYKGALWVPAHKGNYTNANRPKSDPIDKVVVHTMQGSYEGTKAWFRNPDSEVTTHYIMRSHDGEITQMVHEADIAWHAGNWDYNVTSIGIEHEGYVENPDKWYTDEMYESSAELVRWLCDKYDIPIDRDHIIAHSEVPGATHTDPGKGWDWDRYMDLIRDAGSEPVTLDNDDAKVDASGAWNTGDMPGQLGKNHAWTRPARHSDPLWYKLAVPGRGEYRVEVWYPEADDHNDRAPYIVNTTGDWETAYVDQRTGGGTWQSIGEFELDAGEYPVVGVSRWTGGSGKIVADGVRLVKL
ncbi:MAG TPA: N-acetylmuramoyl-L-alanine amidase [Candidatus Stackebrandtia excrementipullorum]|nr:N-acetylmuramoyl-L-alanine amidase [Candidatus Stackebrandtia excrementipullorum]